MEVESLSKRTRGMLVSKIKEAVTVYKKTKVLPKGLSHPTNTCDPFNGNWFEHLMEPLALREVLNLNGFKAEVVPMYYTVASSASRQYLANILNLFIKFLDYKGIYISPGYALSGVKKID